MFDCSPYLIRDGDFDVSPKRGNTGCSPLRCQYLSIGSSGSWVGEYVWQWLVYSESWSHALFPFRSKLKLCSLCLAQVPLAAVCRASVVELPTVESRLAGRSFGRSGRGGFAEDQLADRVETCDAGCGTLGQLQDMGSKAVRPHSQPCCRESRGADGNAPRVWRLFTASACSIWNR